MESCPGGGNRAAPRAATLPPAPRASKMIAPGPPGHQAPPPSGPSSAKMTSGHVIGPGFLGGTTFTFTHATRLQPLLDALQERILVLDGAMGTMLQGYRLGE